MKTMTLTVIVMANLQGINRRLDKQSTTKWDQLVQSIAVTEVEVVPVLMHEVLG